MNKYDAIEVSRTLKLDTPQTRASSEQEVRFNFTRNKYLWQRSGCFFGLHMLQSEHQKRFLSVNLSANLYSTSNARQLGYCVLRESLLPSIDSYNRLLNIFFRHVLEYVRFENMTRLKTIAATIIAIFFFAFIC